MLLVRSQAEMRNMLGRREDAVLVSGKKFVFAILSWELEFISNELKCLAKDIFR